VNFSSLDDKRYKENATSMTWYAKYWKVIIHSPLREESVAIRIAAIPPKRQLGNMKEIKNLFNFSFWETYKNAKNRICIEQR
jgi:hypothetical protein